MPAPIIIGAATIPRIDSCAKPDIKSGIILEKLFNPSKLILENESKPLAARPSIIPAADNMVAPIKTGAAIILRELNFNKETIKLLEFSLRFLKLFQSKLANFINPTPVFSSINPAAESIAAPVKIGIANTPIIDNPIKLGINLIKL
jgi:hypothetical protein